MWGYLWGARVIYYTLYVIGKHATGNLSADVERQSLIQSADKHCA